MFDIGFSELLLIGIVAVLFLGPDKLPKAIVDVAKFFKAVKKTITDAKDTLEKEIHIDEIKSHANDYKNMMNGTMNEINKIKEIPNFDTPEKKDVSQKPAPVEPIITPKAQDNV